MKLLVDESKKKLLFAAVLLCSVSSWVLVTAVNGAVGGVNTEVPLVVLLV
jgi:hypothetical protein